MLGLKRAYCPLRRKKIPLKCRRTTECLRLFERTFSDVPAVWSEESLTMFSPVKASETLSVFTQVSGIGLPDWNLLCTTARYLVPDSVNFAEGSFQKSRRSTSDFSVFENRSSQAKRTHTLRVAADHVYECITSGFITHSLIYLTRGLLAAILENLIVVAARSALFTHKKGLVIDLIIFSSI